MFYFNKISAIVFLSVLSVLVSVHADESERLLIASSPKIYGASGDLSAEFWAEPHPQTAGVAHWRTWIEGDHLEFDHPNYTFSTFNYISNEYDFYRNDYGLSHEAAFYKAIPPKFRIYSKHSSDYSVADLQKGQTLSIPVSGYSYGGQDLGLPYAPGATVSCSVRIQGYANRDKNVGADIVSWRLVDSVGAPLGVGGNYTGMISYSLDGEPHTNLRNIDATYTLNPFALPTKSIKLEMLDVGGNTVVRVPVELESNGCGGCSTSSCDARFDIGSVDLSIGLGAQLTSGFPGGGISNFIQYYSDVIENKGAAALSAAGTVTHDANGVIQTVQVGGELTRVDTLGANPAESYSDHKRFRIRVSSNANQPDSTVYRVVIIENVNNPLTSNLQLRITETLHGKITVTSYESPDVNTWILETGDGLKRETRIKGQDLLENETLRSIVEMRKSALNAQGQVQYEIISDSLTIYQNFPWGREVIQLIDNPDHASPRSTIYSYFEQGQDTGTNGESSTRGVGLLKQMISPDGDVTNYFYYELPASDFYDFVQVVKSTFAGVQDSKVTTTKSMAGTSSSSGFPINSTEVITTVNGIQVSKSEQITEVDDLTNTRMTETRQYSDATNYLVTFTAEDPLSTIVINPDNTGSITEKVQNLANDTFTTTISIGYWDTSGTPSLTLTAKNIIKTNGKGEVIEEESFVYSDDGDGFVASRRFATAFDSLGRTIEYTHYPAGQGGDEYKTENEYGCCGLMRTRDRAGIDTHYMRDELNRVTKVNRLGVTTETVYDGLTTSTHRYPESASGGLLATSLANASNEISRDTVNVFGDIVSSWNRAGSNGGMVETTTWTEVGDLGGGIGRRETTTHPSTPDDGGVAVQSISEYYADGMLYKSLGNASVKQLMAYAAESTGLTRTVAFLDDDGVTPRQAVTTKSDWLGREISRIYASDADSSGSNDFTQQFYNGKGQLVKSVSLDGVATLSAYNLKGELFQQAVDINSNGEIEIGVDRVVEVQRTYSTASAYNASAVALSTSLVYHNKESGSVGATAVNRSEASLDGLYSLQTSYPGTPYATTSRSITTHQGGGSWTNVTVNGLGVGTRSNYEGGLLDEVIYTDKQAKVLYHQGYHYDSLNRLESTSDSRYTGNASVTFVSSSSDLAASTTDTSGRVTSFTYDERNRRTSVDMPDTLDASGTTLLNITNTSYYPSGLVKEENGAQTYRKAYTYDFAQRPQTLTTYGTQTAVTRWVYDVDRGWLTQKLYNSPTAGSGNGPSYTYTPSGQIKSRTWARLHNGNPLVTTYHYGIATGSTASDLDQVTYSDGSAGHVVNSRDLLGSVTTLTDSTGIRTFTYTDHARLSGEAITGSGPLAGVALNYGFDSAGRQASRNLSISANPHQTVTYGFDGAGRVASVGDGVNEASYGFHPVKQLLAHKSFQKNGSIIAQSAHSYDALNRLQAVSFSSTGNSISGEKLHAYHQYTYNDLDQRLRVNLADTSYWDYGYNSKGEVVMGSHKAANGNPLPGQQYGYAFDGIGNRTGASDGSSTSTLANSYTANALNQYSSIGTSPIKHVIGKAPAGSPVTLNGNPTVREGAYYAGALNADNTTPLWSAVSVSDGTATVAGNVYIPAASVAPVYDLDGNLADDGRWSYTWDGGNRLVEMETTSAATTAGMPYARIVFVYDYQGRRIQRERYESAASSTPSETTKYLYHGWNVVAELDATNTVLRKFVWGTDIDGGMQSAGGVGGLLWSEEANGDVHYYGYDGNGNVVVTVNASDGAKSSEYAYSPFGETIQATGVYAGTNRYRFSTKPQEKESSLYYYGHRFLDVVNGRWLSMDPIGERGGVNLYGFVGNDGVNGVDVLGLANWFGQKWAQIKYDMGYLARTSATADDIVNVPTKVAIQTAINTILALVKENELRQQMGNDRYAQRLSNGLFDNTVGLAGETLGRTYVTTAACIEAGVQNGDSGGEIIRNTSGMAIGELFGFRQIVTGIHGRSLEVNDTMTGYVTRELTLEQQDALILEGTQIFSMWLGAAQGTRYVGEIYSPAGRSFVAANSVVPQVLRNQTQGALGEAAVRARLLNSNRLELVGEQMRVTTPGVGSYRVTDFMVQSHQTGRLSIIEVKTGGATRDVTQLAKDALIVDPLVPTTFTGSRSAAAGYPSGTPTGPIRTFEVNASNLRR